MTQMSRNVTLSPTYRINWKQFKFILNIQRVKFEIGRIKEKIEKNNLTRTLLVQQNEFNVNDVSGKLVWKKNDFIS